MKPSDQSRRSFLLAGARAAGVASLAAIPGAPKAVDWLNEQNAVHRDLPETFVESVCGDCPAACPVLLRRVGEHIVGVRPLDPKPCLRVYTIPREIVHSDRIRLPMERAAARGDGRFEAVEIGDAAERLAGLLQAHRNRTAILVRDDSEITSYALASVGNRIGAPLVCRAAWPLYDGPMDAFRESTGWDDWEPDMIHATGVMTFGYDFLQRSIPPVKMQEAFRVWRAGGRRREIVSIGPRMDLTASKADEWLACRVGTDALVAWSIAAVLVKNGWIDPAARAAPSYAAFADKIIAFDVDGAADQAGIKPSDVRRLARHLWNRRWICLGARRRLVFQNAILTLNALLGHLNRKGGWMPKVRVGPDEFRTRSDMDAIPDAILAGQIDLLVIYGENPAFTAPEPARWREAMTKVKSVVVFAEIYTETAALADIVIPIPHASERKMLVIDRDFETMRVRASAPAGTPHPQVGDPLAQTLLTIGERLSEGLDKPLPRTADEFAAHLTAVKPHLTALRFPQALWTPPAYSFGLFHLLFETPLSLIRMSGAHLPYLITAASPHLRRWWETTVEVNPETARTLGISDNDIVRVSSETSSITARAKLYKAIPADAVCMPLGLGHTIGVNAGKVGGNPAELVKFRAEQGVPIWDQTKVTIGKI